MGGLFLRFVRSDIPLRSSDIFEDFRAVEDMIEYTTCIWRDPVPE